MSERQKKRIEKAQDRALESLDYILEAVSIKGIGTKIQA